MNKLIEFNVPNGRVVVETQEAGNGRTTRGGVLAQVTENVGKSFEEALSVIRPVAEATMAACRDMEQSVGSVEVEFGLTFFAGLDVVIAKGSTEGNLHVRLVLIPG